jgi:hypothetical protein
MTGSQEQPPLIAFHLPQFHPIPENDAWWGRGFTEWTSVTRAKPLFPGHYQPHLPADLGFYDLRLPEARQAQAELARQYGIGGFCYYHYWFNGQRLLERPVNDILSSGQPDFPFCLCWANEPWGRNWDGSNKLILVEQKYSPEDDVAHIRSLLPAFADKRYIRVEGKPLFLIYRASHLPEPQRTIERWRDEARRAGVGELYLGRVEGHGADRGDPRPLGFDAAIEFAPDWTCYAKKGASIKQAVRNKVVKVSYKLWQLTEWSWDRVEWAKGLTNPRYRVRGLHEVVSYPLLVNEMLAKPDPGYPRFRGVCPSWDNTARRQKAGARIFLDSSPELYEQWLSSVVQRQRDAGRSRDPIFINAWNEWAEGCHLEPCQQWGRAYLEATARAIGHATSETS